jgi:hypothetical protein
MLLKLIGEKGGCMLLARMSVVHGLRKGITPEPLLTRPGKRRVGESGN